MNEPEYKGKRHTKIQATHRCIKHIHQQKNANTCKQIQEHTKNTFIKKTQIQEHCEHRKRTKHRQRNTQMQSTRKQHNTAQRTTTNT